MHFGGYTDSSVNAWVHVVVLLLELGERWRCLRCLQGEFPVPFGTLAFLTAASSYC